jgi:hypothetical protein
MHQSFAINLMGLLNIHVSGVEKVDEMKSRRNLVGYFTRAV